MTSCSVGTRLRPRTWERAEGGSHSRKWEPGDRCGPTSFFLNVTETAPQFFLITPSVMPPSHPSGLAKCPADRSGQLNSLNQIPNSSPYDAPRSDDWFPLSVRYLLSPGAGVSVNLTSPPPRAGQERL